MKPSWTHLATGGWVDDHTAANDLGVEWRRLNQLVAAGILERAEDDERVGMRLADGVTVKHADRVLAALLLEPLPVGVILDDLRKIMQESILERINHNAVFPSLLLLGRGRGKP